MSTHSDAVASKDAIGRVITILQLTDDGNRLSPTDLYLTQAICNRSLYGVTEAAEQAFEGLYAQVTAGTYDATTQYLQGVRHVTKDFEGYVLWRGKTRIEHYSFADPREEYVAAAKLAAHCLELEARGVPVNGRTAIDPMFLSARGDSPYLPLLLRLYVVFGDSNDRVRGLIVYLPDRRARAIHVLDGALVHRDFADAFDAYHGCGYRRTVGSCRFETYDVAHAAFAASGFMPEAINPLLQGDA